MLLEYTVHRFCSCKEGNVERFQIYKYFRSAIYYKLFYLLKYICILRTLKIVFDVISPNGGETIIINHKIAERVFTLLYSFLFINLSLVT